MSSRLLEYEVWNRINAHQLQHSHGDAVRHLIGRGAMIEMNEPDPCSLAPCSRFPVPVWTDAIHLAALEFIGAQKQNVQLASYACLRGASSRNCGMERGQWPRPMASKVPGMSR